MSQDQLEPVQHSQLDSQLFASLLWVILFNASKVSTLAQLYQLTAYGLDASRQLEIARLAGTVRESLEQAKKQAESIPGADLTIEEQEELIAILEKEVSKRERGQTAASTKSLEDTS